MLPVHINISLSFCVNQDSVAAESTCLSKGECGRTAGGFGGGRSRKCLFVL